MIYAMYAFFSYQSMGPCHGNPKILPTLAPHWVMSRHPKMEILDGWYVKQKWTNGYRRQSLT